MSVISVNFGGNVEDLDFLEPTDEDLAAIEADWDIMDEIDKYFEPELYGVDDDDRHPFDDYDEYDYEEYEE